MRLDKPAGTLLLLWPGLWALWLASKGHPHPWIVVIFVLGTLLMRSAGCVLNDFADRKIDPYVARTRSRPLAMRQMPAAEALGLALVLVAASFVLVCLLNGLAVVLSVPALLVAIIYPYTKRWIAMPQAVLGIAFSFGIPMAFAAETGHLALTAFLLVGANLFWVIAYDTQYAMVDRDDDLTLGVRSSAITFGSHDLLAIGLCFVVFDAIWYWVGMRQGLRGAFWIALAGVLVLQSRDLWMIRRRDRESCFAAFRRSHRQGAVIWLGLVAHFSFGGGT